MNLFSGYGCRGVWGSGWMFWRDGGDVLGRGGFGIRGVVRNLGGSGDEGG